MKLCVRGEGEMTERNTFCSSSDGRNRIETYVWGTSQTEGGWGHGGPNEKQIHPLISNSLIDTDLTMKGNGRHTFTTKCGVAVFCLRIDPYKCLYYIAFPINLYLLITAEISLIRPSILTNCSTECQAPRELQRWIIPRCCPSFLNTYYGSSQGDFMKINLCRKKKNHTVKLCKFLF